MHVLLHCCSQGVKQREAELLADTSSTSVPVQIDVWMSWQIEGSLGHSIHSIIPLLPIETIPLMKGSANDIPAKVRTCSIETLLQFVFQSMPLYG